MPGVPTEDFSKLEFEGWEKVASLYDQSWGNLTRQFSDPLIMQAGIATGMIVLDVACGPGYVSQKVYEKGAKVTGIDFSPEMIRLAKKFHPHIEFREGDAQQLDFPDNSFDAVLMNFGMLHLAKPNEAIAEAARVLRRSGSYAFTVWAGPDRTRAVKLLYETIRKYADMNVNMPAAPDTYMFSDENLCRHVLGENGFDPPSFRFTYHEAEWVAPSADYFFESELNAGVRTADLLKRQSKETLEKIRATVNEGMHEFFDGKQYRLRFSGCIISASTI